MNQNDIFYNINNKYNNYFNEDELNKNGRYPNIKAYIKSYLDSLEKQYDSDVSEYSMKIYTSKWKGFKYGNIIPQNNNAYNKNNYKKNIFISNDDYLIRGDTLNSMKHIFTHFLTEFCKNISDTTYKSEKWGNNKYEKILTEFDYIFSDKNLDDVQWSRLILGQFEIFASLSDTIGNQFPCLPMFNCERSNYGKHDFCDLLLDTIYRYLKSSKDTNILKALFIGVQDKYNIGKHIECSITRVQHWLDKYFNNNWDYFVEENCFQYFVKYDVEEKKYNESIKLWKDHSLDNLSYPTINETLYEMLKFINQGILVRGYLIYQK